MGLSFAEKSKKIDFPKIMYKNVHCFNLWHAHISNQNLDFYLCDYSFVITHTFLAVSFPFSLPFYSGYLSCFLFFLAVATSWVNIWCS